MKKKGFAAVCLAAIMLATCVLFAGCLGGESAQTASKEYVIQYADSAGTHTLTVADGMPYAIETIPVKTGYTFTGLFDAEEGGVRYVSANGASIEPFTDKKNMVLFPQFTANEYTVILDYQGAPVAGSRSFTVAYGSNLPELPDNPFVAHKVFKGWYTQPDRGGIRISDEYGLLPVVSVFNENNFDISGTSVTLYAGFEGIKYNVTLCFDGGTTEKIEAEYDMPVSKILSQTRVNGNAALTWSLSRDGEPFTGGITSDTTLYAVEYAPVIEFDTVGGGALPPVVARAGDALVLPTPVKTAAKFLYWTDENGEEYNADTMPEKSTTLKAAWQAKLEFDENGGTDVDDISVAAGEKISLPVPERVGYLFAGWYTADNALYASETMPAAGIALKAGWYKEKTDTVILISSTYFNDYSNSAPSTGSACYEIDYGKYAGGASSATFKIDWHVNIRMMDPSAISVSVDFYSRKQISSYYLMDTVSFDNITNSYKTCTFSTVHSVSDSFYACWYRVGGWDGAVNKTVYHLTDYYYTIHYPDTGALYL